MLYFKLNYTFCTPFELMFFSGVIHADLISTNNCYLQMHQNLIRNNDFKVVPSFPAVLQ